jgi:hydrogenase expression/formation protein HypC
MCIGIPMRIVEAGPGRAWCEGRGRRERLDTWLVGEQPAGTWVLAFHGSAMRVLGDDEAERTNAAIDALEAAIAGAQDLDAYFGDLVLREQERERS